MSLKSYLFVSALILPVVSVGQNSGTYSESLLNTKRIFSKGLAVAIGEPYEGIVVSDGKREGLFRPNRRV